MGAIFVTKCSLTLQTDMLGTPEILWEHDRFDAQLGESSVMGDMGGPRGSINGGIPKWMVYNGTSY